MCQALFRILGNSNSLKPHTAPCHRYYSAHFTDKETEAQRRYLTHSGKSHSRDLKFDSLGSTVWLGQKDTAEAMRQDSGAWHTQEASGDHYNFKRFFAVGSRPQLSREGHEPVTAVSSFSVGLEGDSGYNTAGFQLSGTGRKHVDLRI